MDTEFVNKIIKRHPFLFNREGMPFSNGNKRVKNNMKKKLALFISIGFAVAVFLNLSIQQITVHAAIKPTTITETKDNNINEIQYNNNIRGVREINLDQFLQKKKNSESFIIYIGFKECPHCRKFSPILKKFIKLSNKPIYYLDYGPESSFKYADKETIQDFLASFNAPFEFAGTPTVALFVNNKLVSMAVGDDTTLDDLQHILSDSNN